MPPADLPGVAEPPSWLTGINTALDAALPEWFTKFAPPPDPAIRSAVLILFAAHEPRPGETGPGAGFDVVLTERAAMLRSHAAQVVFPGGKIDPTDDGPVAAALRESNEEVGLDPDSVEVVAALPALFMHPSQNAITPVLGWWRDPHPIDVVDYAEVARVVRADLSTLVDPANRFTVTAPGGYRGPGFAVQGLFVWGFTATLLDHVLDFAGLSQEWDAHQQRPLPEHLLAPYRAQGWRGEE